MDTNIHRQYRTRFREHRLISLDSTRRHDLLEEAEVTGGKMEDGSSLTALESETQKIAKQILAQRVGWGEWVNSFFRSSSVIDKKAQDTIRTAAEQHIGQETDLAIGKVWGFFRRGKRQLYLAMRDKISEQIRQDLAKHLEKRTENSRERLVRYSGLADALSNRTSPLKFKNEKEKKRLQDRLARLEGTFTQNTPVDAALTDTWREAQEAEDVITQHLLKTDAVPADRLVDLFERNSRGDHTLQDLVKASSALASDPDMVRFILKALKDFRRGDRKFYRLQKRTETDVNAGTLQQRLVTLRTGASMLGRSLTLVLNGAPSNTRIISRTDEDALILKTEGKQEYLVLDTKTGEVTYRDSARVFHDIQLKETSFTLAA